MKKAGKDLCNKQISGWCNRIRQRTTTIQRTKIYFAWDNRTKKRQAQSDLL